MVNQKGFTLIELVMVIVILGILAAIALPKYVNFKKEAVIATMKNLEGAMNSASTLVFLKATIQGLNTSPSSTLSINGENIDLVYGYPAATQTGIGLAISLEADDWDNNIRDGQWHSRESTLSGAWVYWHGSYDTNIGGAGNNCYVRYWQAADINTSPRIDAVFDDCE